MSPAREDVLDALKSGQPQILSGLLSAHPDQVNSRDANGTPLLVIAVFIATAMDSIPTRRGSPSAFEVIEVLLAAGADPSSADATGATGLHSAARCGHADLIAMLRHAGASLEGQLMGTTGGSPQALALFYGRADMAGKLGPITPDNLRHAAALGRPLDRFLDGEALRPEALVGLDFYRPSDSFPIWERTFVRQEVLDEALTWAARNGQLVTMEALVALGADVNANPYRGTALLWAVYRDLDDVAAWLLDRGADLDLAHDFGGSGHGSGAVAMHLAAQYGGLRCLRLLLDRGADRTVVDAAFGGTPLGWALHSGQKEAARLLGP